jgi:hypothetical protein
LKGKIPMPVHYPLRHLLCVGPAVVAVLLVACGRSPLDANVVALDVPDSGGLPTKPVDDSGLGTKGDDSGLGTKDDDSGLGAKDAGEGIKDSGLGTNDDSGLGAEDSGPVPGDAGPAPQDAGPAPQDAGPGDAGPGTPDAGPGTPDSGTGAADAGSGEDSGTGTPDAGGGIFACFSCAEQRCGKRVNSCVGSPACVAEGECDLACLTGSGKGAFGGLNAQCLQSCTKDLLANQELLSAVSCAFTFCPTECVSALDPFLGGSGLGGH